MSQNRIKSGYWLIVTYKHLKEFKSDSSILDELGTKAVM